uniref:C2H2-type domain-containing protein n=1 Tax=Romanomermis culicivorax TaxID=13658 RepID=A0A915L520_ROMCU
MPPRPTKASQAISPRVKRDPIEDDPQPIVEGKRRIKPTARFLAFQKLKREPRYSDDDEDDDDLEEEDDDQQELEEEVEASSGPRRGVSLAGGKRRLVEISEEETSDREEEAFKCTICGAVFSTKRGLTAHNVHKHRRGYRAAQQTTQLIDDRDESENDEYVYGASEPSSDEGQEESIQPPYKIGVKPDPDESHQPQQPKLGVIGVMCGLEMEEDEMEQEEAVEAMMAKKEAPAAQHPPSSSRPTPSSSENRKKLVPDPILQIQDDDDDDIESYPCKLCENGRVFLTSLGLTLHTTKVHPESIEEVKQQIQELQDERKRKEEARRAVGPQIGSSMARGASLGIGPSIFGGAAAGKLLSRQSMLPPAPAPRRSTTAASNDSAAEKENEPQRTAAAGGAAAVDNDYSYSDQTDDDEAPMVHKLARRQRTAMVRRARFTTRRPTGRHRRSLHAPKAKYQSCEICGILINTDHPKAMESHTKAHKKNEDLRHNLLRTYGPNYVENVTCRECNLVFKDEEKLEQHRRHRRHPDMFDLTGYRRPASDFPSLTNQTDSLNDPSSLVGDAGNAEEFSCHTSCEVCGMHMVRPSNLIRHMKQVHNRTSFTAQVETKGMPPFKVDATEGRFLWGCCDEIYDDRHLFIAHRRTAHGPQAYAGAPRECDHCGMMFRNNLLYINHLRTHRPRICQICGQSFGIASAVDSSLYRAHMLQHKEQGFSVNMPHIEEELAQKGYDPSLDVATRLKEMELAQEDDELDDNAGSGDEYSIFSESGIESECDENRSLFDEHDDAYLLTTCPVCNKKFDCVFRFSDHWNLHLKLARIDYTKIKTPKYVYNSQFSRLFHKCIECGQKFFNRSNLAAHFLTCRKVRRAGRLRNVVVEKSTTTTITERDVVDVEQSSVEKLIIDSKTPKMRKKPSKSKFFDFDNDDDPSIEKNVGEEDPDMMDCLEIEPERQNAEPVGHLPEKAYVVAWDTNKTTSDSNPYVCITCKEKLGDFTSLLLHVQTHVEKPIGGKIGDRNKKSRNEEFFAIEEKPVKIADEDAAGKSQDDDDGKTMTRAFVLSVKTAPMFTTAGYSTCHVCRLQFENDSSLREHFHLKHGNRRQTRCDVCGKSFWTAKGLRRHLKRHDLSKFYCNTCDKRFVSYETLTKHQTVHELTYSVYQCEDCAEPLYTLALLKNHFKVSHPGINLLSCPVCARIHTDMQGLNEHFDAEHSATKSKCGLCFKYFKTPMKVEEHVKRAHRLKFNQELKCNLCSKILVGYHKLAIHKWAHHRQKKFVE